MAKIWWWVTCGLLLALWMGGCSSSNDSQDPLGSKTPKIAAGDSGVSVNDGAPLPDRDGRDGAAINDATPDAQAIDPRATGLMFRVEPRDLEAGSAMTPALEVIIVDSNGQPIATAAPIKLELSGGDASARLSGTQIQTAQNGVATFQDLTVDRPGDGYVLTATSQGLTSAVSKTFRVRIGGPAKLVFLGTPGQARAGAPIPNVQVAITDLAGNTTVSNAATIALTLGSNPTSTTLSGTTSVGSVSGIAQFSNVAVNSSGSGFTLVASASGLKSATSAPFNVDAGPPHHLAFRASPSAASLYVPMRPVVDVEVRDRFDNIATDPLTVQLEMQQANVRVNALGRIGNAQPYLTTVAGIASFDDLLAYNVGSGFTLVASSPNLTSATTTPFSVDVGTAPPPPTAAPSNTCRQTFPPTTRIPCSDISPVGTQYYVSSASGLDTNSGLSSGAPFRTLEKAVATAPSGSTIRVAAGVYQPGVVVVSSDLLLLGGYDANFATRDPDRSRTIVTGRLQLSSPNATVSGFRLIGRPDDGAWRDSGPFHDVRQGKLIQNYIEVVDGTQGQNPSYVVTASLATIACNDIVSQGVRIAALGTSRVGGGLVSVTQNRICTDRGAFDTSGERGGSFLNATFTNNIVESRGTFASSLWNASLTFTNNTAIIDTGAILNSLEFTGDVTFTNNVVVAINGRLQSPSNSEIRRRVSSHENNLITGFGTQPSDNLFSDRGVSNDTTGTWTLATLFRGAAQGDLGPLLGGPCIGTGKNVYGDAAYGNVTVDLIGALRPQSAPWDRGALRGP